MPVRSFPLKRATALLLPVATLWLWAACASICGQAAAAHSLRPSSAGLAEMKAPSVCEGCPFASFPKATAPDTRAASDASPQTPVPSTPSATAAGPAAAYSAPAWARRPPPPADPPLELLPVLRI